MLYRAGDWPSQPCDPHLLEEIVLLVRRAVRLMKSSRCRLRLAQGLACQGWKVTTPRGGRDQVQRTGPEPRHARPQGEDGAVEVQMAGGEHGALGVEWRVRNVLVTAC